ncbi:MAG: hypothetical protein ACI4KB_01450 [Oscillospiraceae bacterium]|nr:hypothetical protein [Oscillospiraceae bacterium]
MEGIYNSLQMEEITDQFDPGEMEEQKVISILVFFIEFLFFIPIVSYKDSAYAKTVANQALTLFVAGIALGIVGSIIGMIPFIGGLIAKLISLLLVVLAITKIIDAANGKIRNLPFGIIIPAFK